MRFPSRRRTAACCSSSKIPARGSSYEIDERVKAIVAEGLSVYRVDVERLRELQPDLILTQTQCAVCAVTPRDLEEALCTWVGNGAGDFVARAEQSRWCLERHSSRR